MWLVRSKPIIFVFKLPVPPLPCSVMRSRILYIPWIDRKRSEGCRIAPSFGWRAVLGPWDDDYADTRKQSKNLSLWVIYHSKGYLTYIHIHFVFTLGLLMRISKGRTLDGWSSIVGEIFPWSLGVLIETWDAEDFIMKLLLTRELGPYIPSQKWRMEHWMAFDEDEVQ